MITKRTVILGGYNTAVDGLWTLTSLDFPEPAPVENLQDVPGRVLGPLDLSTTLTEGEPRYGARTLSVTLESSEGTRDDRAAIITSMVNRLHGRRVQIVLPDYPGRYVVGRVALRLVYNDLAHASMEVTATCEPWIYAMEQTQVVLQAAEEKKTAAIRNPGALPVVPVLEVTAAEGQSILLEYGTSSKSMSAGVYQWPTLWLTPGEHEVTYSGAGTLAIKYREGVLR